MAIFSKILSFPLLLMVRLYQKTISFDHGAVKFLYPDGYCRFYPSCSEYTHQAIDRFGPIRGLFLSFKRVFRCHPWAKGGIDEVPRL